LSFFIKNATFGLLTVLFTSMIFLVSVIAINKKSRNHKKIKQQVINED
jgi:hypothetical protein